MTKMQRYFFATEDHVERLLSKVDLECNDPLSLKDVLSNNNISYYPIFGHISDNQSYCTSYTIRQFEHDLKINDVDSKTSLHFIHISSSGGDAWYMNELSATLQGLTRPIYVLAERICCSAAYYIACSATRLVSLNKFDIIGSVGTMTEVFDSSEADKKWGLRTIQIRASRSDLKNKTHDNILDGDTNDYVSRFLDPLQNDFEKNVLSSRPSLNSLPKEHSFFRGEIFQAHEALSLGIIDGIVGNIDNAVSEAISMAKTYQNINQLNNFIR